MTGKSKNLLLSRACGDQDASAQIAARLLVPAHCGLSEFCDVPIDLQIGGMGAHSYAAWETSHGEPATIAMFANAIAVAVAIDEVLIAELVERRFGGMGGTPRPSGAAGRLLRSALVAHLAAALSSAFPAIGESIPMDADSARAARADDIIATVTLNVAIAGHPCANINLAFPTGLAERLARDPQQHDAPRWRDDLQANILRANLPVRAVVARADLSADAIANLTIGHVLPIPKPETVPLLVGSTAFATGQLSERDGRTVFHIETMESVCDDR